MGIQVGDQLFGYPVVAVTPTLVSIRLPGNMDVSFDIAQFTSEVLLILQGNGQYVPF